MGISEEATAYLRGFNDGVSEGRQWLEDQGVTTDDMLDTEVLSWCQLFMEAGTE